MPASTELGKLIKKKKWEHVISRARLFPEEATVKMRNSFHCGTTIQCLPIHAACMRKPPLGVIIALIAADTRSVQVKDSLGRLALHHACRYGASVEIINILQATYPEGVRTMSDGDGCLPVHFACLHGDSSEVVEFLVKAYPTCWDVCDRSGLTPLDYATDNPLGIKQEFVRIIQQYGREASTIHEACKLQDLCIGQSTGKVSNKVDDDHHNKTCSITESGSRGSASTCEERSPTKVCVVCMDKSVRRILVPCGHPCLCDNCGEKEGMRRMGWRCPECRAEVRKAIRFFGRVVDD